MNRSTVWVAAVCAALLASVLSPLDAPRPAGASASVEPDAVPDDIRGSATTGAGVQRPERRQTPDGADPDGEEQSSNGHSDAGTTLAAPVLGEGFALRGEWLAPGLVGLDWDDVDRATGYELLARGIDGWVLLGSDDPVDGIVAVFDGPVARVGGLSEDAEGYWFAVRARSTHGVSLWSESVMVEVPGGAGGSGGVLFDPFTEPTLSGIDLERLGRATA
ncbi:MAG: hypothetical protein OXM54_17165 [Acidimicrobiaceae bacterium]|nr:hypothetical protein [Acidimicrobiaceae bacterium]